MIRIVPVIPGCSEAFGYTIEVGQPDWKPIFLYR
jgi:hypothetical protein